MEAGVCIRIWTRDTIPARFADLARFADDGEEALNTAFVAHVPAAMLADESYRFFTGGDATSGWTGLFGVNCLDSVPHPDGDGLMVIGSYL